MGRPDSGISDAISSDCHHWTLQCGRDTRRQQPDQWARVSKKKPPKTQSSPHHPVMQRVKLQPTAVNHRQFALRGVQDISHTPGRISMTPDSRIFPYTEKHENH